MHPKHQPFYGERIRIIRIIKGLSLQDIATMLGLSKNAIHKMEHDQIKPAPATLIGMCKLLDVPEDFFAREVVDLKIIGSKLKMVNSNG